MRTTITILAGALAACTLVPAVARSATAPEASSCATSVETLTVEAEPRRDHYRIGQTAVVDVWVTDRFTGLPKGKTDAGLLLQPMKEDDAALGVERTDAQGHAVIRIKLARDLVKPGSVDASVMAWEWINTPAYCANRYGTNEYPDFFHIAR